MTTLSFEQKGQAARAVLNMAWPMALKAIMLHGVVVIDALLVAPLGEASLAGMGIAGALVGLGLGTLLAFANAGQIRIAQAFGGRDTVFLRTAFVSGLVVSLVLGVAGFAALSLFGPAAVAQITDEPAAVRAGLSYLNIFVFVLVWEAVSLCLSAYFNGCGKTHYPLYSYLVSVPVNVVLSYGLIHGTFGMPALGVAGAAWGSLAAVMLQTTFLGACFFQLGTPFAGVRGWRNGTFMQSLNRHVRFSLPIAATFVSSTAAAQVCTLLYAQLGLNAFAAMALVTPWIMVAGTIGMSWAQATGIIAAQLLGKRRAPATLDRFLTEAWRGAFVAAGAVSAIYVTVCLSASWLYPNLTAETRSILLSFAMVLFLLPFPKGSNAICGNTLRASGDTLYVMHIFVWSQWLFRVPATALAVLVFNVPAVFVLSLLLLEELVKFPAFHRRLWSGHWKTADVSQ